MVGMLLLVPGLAGQIACGQTDRLSEGTQGNAAVTRGARLGQGLHLTASIILSHKSGPGEQILSFRKGFSLSFAGCQLTSDRALVWIGSGGVSLKADSTPKYRVQVYLKGEVSRPSSGGRQAPAEMTEVTLEEGEAIVVTVGVDGEIFVTADDKATAGDDALPFYREAAAAFEKAGASVPAGPESMAVEPPSAGTAESKAEPNEPQAGFTVSIMPLTDVEIERNLLDSGEEVVTIIGRILILWQQDDEAAQSSTLFELRADSLVVWRGGAGAAQPAGEAAAIQETGVSQIYVAGDVQFRQGQRTILADELYYDLRQQRALAKGVVMSTYDPTRNIPIYVWAKELRQLGANEFEGQDITLTTSEFWTPQLSFQAAKIHVLDEGDTAEPRGFLPDSSLDVELRDVAFKYGNITLLKLPVVRSDREVSDVPIRSIHVGHNKAYGTSVETRWFLSRILGLREPEGTDASLALDYYGDRGMGGGADVSYERDNYFGSVLGYAIDDHGDDRLSRTRKDVAVPDEMRGRFKLQHRHFLPYSWQLTAEVSYLSDKNFLEQFYRTEFNIGKEQETLLHLKRIEDNWGLAFLGKTRINDFMDQVEELPTAEFHLTGQSLFDDRLTFFSDNQVSRYRYRFSPENPLDEPDEFFTFTGTRNELDMPLTVGDSKVVPFVAGTFGYDDGAGFQSKIDGEPMSGEDAIWIGEAGVRMSTQPFWCVYPSVESRLLDLHQLRHIVRPSITAVAYTESDAVAEQRDTLDLEIAQRWQTKRGPAGHRRTVNWIELDMDFVWVNDSSDELAGPDRFIWSYPFIPLANRAGTVIPPLDRRTTDLFGPRHNYVSTETILRLTDTTAVLSDLYFDMQDGVIEQFDVGFSRLCWPNLSYYLGSRYLRDIGTELGERGSNALTFAATYVLDSRYTAVFSEQYDVDYGANIRTDITLIRKYHRMNLALTFSIDDSLDEQRIVFSLWPQGVPELSFGLRRYMELGASDVYY